MTKTAITDGIVLPQDEGTGLSSEEKVDRVSAAHSALLAQHVQGSYIGDGCEFANVDTNGASAEVTAGHAFVELENATVQAGGGEAYDTALPDPVVLCVVLPTAVRIDLAADVANEIWVALDKTANDTAYLWRSSAGEAPPDPHVKLGTVNTSDGSTTRASDDIPVSNDVDMQGRDVSGIGSADIDALVDGADVEHTDELADVADLHERYSDEEVEDVVGTLIAGGANVYVSYDDAGDSLTIDTSALNPEEVQDEVDGLLTGGTGIGLTYDDAADTLTIDAQREQVEDWIGALVSGGDKVTVTHDDAGDDIQIDTSALDAEEVRDEVGSLLDVGSDLTINVDDAGDTVTIGLGAHVTNHESGGSDELSVEGLPGDLADPQDPKTHGNADHSETFAVDGDEQPPETHGSGDHDDSVPELADGVVLSSQIPDLAITETHSVADETERLALDAEEGDVAIQSDESRTYIFTGGDPSLSENWSNVLFPEPPIDTVFGRTGDVTAQSGDYTYSDISGTHGNADHSETFAVDGDAQPPETHGNADHDPDFLPSSDYQPEADTHDRYTNEEVQDVIGALLSGGTNITASYDDANDVLTIGTSALSQEEVEGAVASLLTADDNLTLNYDDGNDVLTVGLSSDVSVENLTVSNEIQTGSLEADTLNNADLATASTDTVPVAQGDGTLAMAEAGGGLTPQGYVDEEANRSFNTTYQNTTGGPLEVFVSVVADADGDDIRSRIDMSSGSTVTIGAGPGGPRIASANQNDEITTQAFVPDGYYYEVSDIDGSISSWHEQEWS